MLISIRTLPIVSSPSYRVVCDGTVARSERHLPKGRSGGRDSFLSLTDETSPWSRCTYLYPHRGKLTSSAVPAVALLQFPGLVIWRQHVSPPLRSFAFQGHAVLSMFLKATGRLPRPLSARRSGVSALRCCLPRRSGRLGPAA